MDGALPLLMPQWPAPAGVRALTTRRHGAGVSLPPFDQFNLGNRHAADGDQPAHVERNRALLHAGLALPSPAHWLRQVHGTTVLRFDAAPVAGASEPVADAAVTSVPGVVLAILTADCLPVVLAARDGSEVGAAHAGWRGLADGMLEATVAAMQTPPSGLLAWLGRRPDRPIMRSAKRSTMHSWAMTLPQRRPSWRRVRGTGKWICTRWRGCVCRRRG